jgi:hypothetical protein
MLRQFLLADRAQRRIPVMHDGSDLGREVFNLLHPGLQQPDQIVHLRVAELREVRQA